MKPAGLENPEPPKTMLQPQFDYLEHACISFHDDDEAVNAPTMSSTTSERAMVKLLKILEDMSAPDYAVEVIIKWAQAALADGFDFCPKTKSRSGNLTHIYNAVHNSTLMLPSIVPVLALLKNHSPVDVIVYNFVPHFLLLLQDASLMTGSNVKCNLAIPFAQYQLPRNMLGKLHSGSVYNQMYDKLITDRTCQLLALL
jgi:hypothetical protein